MDFDVPIITVEDCDQFRRNLGSQTPKWILSIWDQQHAIQPAMLRVPLVIFSFLLLWAVNIFFIECAKVPYYSVLSVKNISSFALLIRALLALSLYGLVVTAANVFHMEIEQSMIGFYFLVVVIAVVPFVPGSDGRLHFMRLLRQVVYPMPSSTYLSLNYPSTAAGGVSMKSMGVGVDKEKEKEEAQSLLQDGEGAAATVSVVPFVEILLADALCSLSKVFKDLGTSFVALYAYTVGTSAASYHYGGMMLMALLASAPYM